MKKAIAIMKRFNSEVSYVPIHKKWFHLFWRTTHNGKLLLFHEYEVERILPESDNLCTLN